MTVERPLRLRIVPDTDISMSETLKADEKNKCQAAMQGVPSDTPLDDWNQYAKALNLPKTLTKKLRSLITVRDENAEAVEGETDRELRDVEQVPLRYEGGIDAFMQREVLPYAPDAFYVPEDVVVGYELSFTKYFYKPVQLRPITDITADIRGIEQRLKGTLDEILSL